MGYMSNINMYFRVKNLYAPNTEVLLQSNVNGSNIFETIEICSWHGRYKQLTLNQCVSAGGKMGII